MKTTMNQLFLSAMMVATLCGCSGVPTAVGTRSAGPVPTGTERVISAEGCGFQLLLFIPISINDRMSRAYRILEADAAGDYITDVKVQESWTYGLVGTEYCTKLFATAIRPTAQATQ